jgi:alpha-N-arabinofuranosidase
MAGTRGNRDRRHIVLPACRRPLGALALVVGACLVAVSLVGAAVVSRPSHSGGGAGYSAAGGAEQYTTRSAVTRSAHGVLQVAAGGAGNAIVVGGRPLQSVSRYLFGANLLWASGAEGAFNPSTGTFKPAFVADVRKMGITALRYPGGETSDSFQWQRAIGPMARRLPVEPYGMQAASLSPQCCILDGPQRPLVGPDEFGRLLDQVGAVGTITVNFASGTAQQAADFVAYMTAKYRGPGPYPQSSPSYWAAMRAANGHRAPYPVPYWEVGNEQFFPGQFGWRSGYALRIGPHPGYCPAQDIADCLYAFGGTTAFWDQTVGKSADQRPSASYSDGQPGQSFFVYFPPVVPSSAVVQVNGRAWARVANLAVEPPGADIYALDTATGEIRFGDGSHGAVPPRGALITASYSSGPHAGFVQYYQAMKRVSPNIHVCASDGMDLAFLQMMGRRFHYDCLALHEYARPADILAPLPQYERGLMNFPSRQASQLRQLQRWALKYSGRHVPVVLTEYGQLVAPVPATDPAFNLSLYEGLYLSAQLIEWADNGVPLAEKYLLDSNAFDSPALSSPRLATDLTHEPASVRREELLRDALQAGRTLVRTGLSPNSALVAHQGPVFVEEPTGEAISLMSALAGTRRLPISIVDRGRRMSVGTLWALAGVAPSGAVQLAVVNASTNRSWRARVAIPMAAGGLQVSARVLDGPSTTAFNTPQQPQRVAVKHWSGTAQGSFYATFPAHSLTVLQISRPLPLVVAAAGI